MVEFFEMLPQFFLFNYVKLGLQSLYVIPKQIKTIQIMKYLKK